MPSKFIKAVPLYFQRILRQVLTLTVFDGFTTHYIVCQHVYDCLFSQNMRGKNQFSHTAQCKPTTTLYTYSQSMTCACFLEIFSFTVCTTTWHMTWIMCLFVVSFSEGSRSLMEARGGLLEECESCKFWWVPNLVILFHWPSGVIISSVGLAGWKAIVASSFIFGDILNLVKTSFYRNHRKYSCTEYYMIYSKRPKPFWLGHTYFWSALSLQYLHRHPSSS